MNSQLQAISAKAKDLDGEPWEIAEALNSPDPAITSRIHTPVATARGLLLARGEWAAIVLTADNQNADMALRAACITVRDTLSPPMSTVHTGDPATLAVITQCLDGLVAASVLTPETRDALLALSVVPISWAQANLGQQITARDVALAMGAE